MGIFVSSKALFPLLSFLKLTLLLKMSFLMKKWVLQLEGN